MAQIVRKVQCLALSLIHVTCWAEVGVLCEIVTPASNDMVEARMELKIFSNSLI